MNSTSFARVKPPATCNRPVSVRCVVARVIHFLAMMKFLRADFRRRYCWHARDPQNIGTTHRAPWLFHVEGIERTDHCAATALSETLRGCFKNDRYPRAIEWKRLGEEGWFKDLACVSTVSDFFCPANVSERESNDAQTPHLYKQFKISSTLGSVLHDADTLTSTEF